MLYTLLKCQFPNYQHISSAEYLFRYSIRRTEVHKQKIHIFSIVVFVFQNLVSKKIIEITMVLLLGLSLLFDLLLNIKGTDWTAV